MFSTVRTQALWMGKDQTKWVYEENPQDLQGGFSEVKAPSNEDGYLSFGNPAVSTCSCLISVFALTTSDRFAFSRKNFCSLFWENVLGVLGETYRNVRGKLEKLWQLTPVMVNQGANHDQEGRYTSEAFSRSLA